MIISPLELLHFGVKTPKRQLFTVVVVAFKGLSHRYTLD